MPGFGREQHVNGFSSRKKLAIDMRYLHAYLGTTITHMSSCFHAKHTASIQVASYFKFCFRTSSVLTLVSTMFQVDPGYWWMDLPDARPMFKLIIIISICIDG